ncbi:hypothetical protein [Roseobacter sp.]|uniref:hypothetical protein n=1 Tax=Roseobacter sp. TaxID=1907202 RepID=UPI003299B79A
MIRRLLTYSAAVLGGFATWAALSLFEAAHPFLPWNHPLIAMFTGRSFPGGASLGMHYSNPVLETWFPFLVAFAIAYAVSRKRARFGGACMSYAVFLGWSLGLVLLVENGMSLALTFNIGLTGTIIGGAVCYLRLVEPATPP